jgi:hypothetical protein
MFSEMLDLVDLQVLHSVPVYGYYAVYILVARVYRYRFSVIVWVICVLQWLAFVDTNFH